MNRAKSALLLLGPIVAIEAYSETYLTQEKAASLLFPGISLAKSTATLNSDQIAKIKELSSESVRDTTFTLFKAPSGEWVAIDRVIGKHEYITYAVGIKDGKIKGIEILEYREAYGGQVRGDSWRAQFVGKDSSAPIQVDKDIKNISGATMSSNHLTAGVRRVLRTYEVLTR